MQRLKLLPAVFLLGGVAAAQDAARSSGWVVIPVNQYEVLRSKAYPVDRPAAPPTVDATLTRVDYDLRLDGAVASGRASLTVDVLKDGWAGVPIPQGLLVREARLGGKPLSLVPLGRGGQLHALLSTKGRSVLLLDVAFNVVSAAGEERLSLPASGSGVTRAAVANPPPDVEVKVTGGLMSEKSPARWIAYGRGGEALTVAWHKRRVEESRVELPLRMRGSCTQIFALGEDSTSLNAEVSIEVVQGAARQVRIAVPGSVTINEVPGATVADWDVKGGELVVNFLDPVEHTAKFAIAGEARLAREGAIDVPMLRLLETERDTGGVAVEVLGAGEIKGSKLEGLEPAEPADLGQMVAARTSPSLTAFRFRPAAAGTAPARSLQLEVARYTQQAVLTALIEEARYRLLMSAEGKTLVEARYAVRNNQRNFVRIALPRDATVWSSLLASRPVRPGKAPDGSLLFPLTKGRAGEEAPLFAIEILYLARGSQWIEKGRASLPLPGLDLPVSRSGVVLYYSPLFRVTAEAGAFRTQPFERPASTALTAAAEPPPAAEAPPAAKASAAQSATQALVDQYRAGSGARRTAAALPIRVSFPAVGPSLYLVSELTGESKTPLVELSYQKERKGGVK